MSEFELLKKEHSECAKNKNLEQKIKALKSRNADLAKKQEYSLINQSSLKEKALEENLNSMAQVNNLMKEAMINLKINEEVPEDSSFFENAFKAL
eukprot:CAMPEP_0205810054 /NCGR_PEP_ID=MMETSP0205-20121125/14248_1 /ASSEMBLY_ACC=CAM_ASM_000278 /TAXON_ID=36767 /ORGANISM="Euplotes focardii, Strain TN1" /LENGTH=94 /DNA_ID=CAMNT_0053087829 /DNA_START=1091 /DNA_END=1375 /DNA_ORIENTATION=-